MQLFFRFFGEKKIKSSTISFKNLSIIEKFLQEKILKKSFYLWGKFTNNREKFSSLQRK